ncbi:MAG: sugar phosphate isomerase/epimerase [Clostridia bacterium]|nr:sugar phosphate isomerase/epimerase [Clostridia bacterium]
MKQFKVGLQLFSIRDKMEQDMDAALKAVKEMGYDYVEFAGYFGKTAEEVKTLLDKYGLTAISVHQTPSLFWEEGQAAVDYLKTIGAKYCAIPWYSIDELQNHWEETVEKFTSLGELLKENGIQLLYHNHDFELKPCGDTRYLDRLYDTLDKKFFMPEFDVCWIRYAGYNPVQYIEKYCDRMEILHLKDFTCDRFGGGPVYGLIDENGKEKPAPTREETGFRFQPLGRGLQDWNAILDAADHAGCEYVIVEMDDSYDEDSLETARQSRQYLKEEFGI